MVAKKVLARKMSGPGGLEEVTLASADLSDGPCVPVADTPLVSTGCRTQPVFTDNGDGTATVSSVVVNIFGTSDFSGQMFHATVPAATLGPFTNGSEEYISIRYNGGTPIYARETVGSVMNHSDNLPVLVVWRLDMGAVKTLHSLNFDSLGAGLANKAQSAMYHTDLYQVSTDGGLVISEGTSPAPRTISCTSALVYTGAIMQTVGAFTSSTDQMTEAVHSAPGVWSYADKTVYNNTQVDDGTGTLTNIHANKYGVRWFYRSIGDAKQIFYVLGSVADHNSIASAALEAPRTDLPTILRHHCMLVGRAIIQYNATSGLTESTLEVPLGTSVLLNHNDTANIQDAPEAVAGEHYHLNSTQATRAALAANMHTVTKEGTGFASPTDVVVTYNSTTRKVTLTGTVTAYWQDDPIDALVSGWESAAHADEVGAWFLYYNGSAFAWAKNAPWTFDVLQICYVYYQATTKFALRECHGLMGWQTHQEFHQTLGTYRISGGAITGIVLNSTTAANRRPAVADCVVADEDLSTTILAKAASLYTQMTLVGSGATSTFTLNAAEMVPVVGNVAYYNRFTTTWVQTALTGNQYAAVWLLGIPTSSDAESQTYRYVWVQGQAATTTLATANAWTFSELNLGDLRSVLPEFVPLAKVLIRANAAGNNWTVISVTELSLSRGGSAGPSGYLAAVSVTAPLTGDGTVANPLQIPSFTDATDITPGTLASGAAQFAGGASFGGQLQSRNLHTGPYTPISGAGGQHFFRDDTATSRYRLGLANGAASVVFELYDVVAGVARFQMGPTGAFSFTSSLNSANSMFLRNSTSGTLAETRLVLQDDASAVGVSLTVPSAGNTSAAIFGLSRTAAAFIFTSTVARALGIGTTAAQDLVLGTNNTARVVITASGAMTFSGPATFTRSVNSNTGVIDSVCLVSNKTGSGAVTPGDITELNSAATFTISLAVARSGSVASTEYLFYKHLDATNRLNAYFATDNRLYISVYNGSSTTYGYLTSAATLFADGICRTVVIVYDGGGVANADRLKLYVDGVLQTLTFAGTIPATTANLATAVLYIQGTGTTTLNGWSRSFRIYTTALSASDVLFIHQGTAVAGAVHEWLMQEGIGTTIVDTGSNPVNATLTVSTTFAWGTTSWSGFGTKMPRTLISLPPGTTKEYGISAANDTYLYRSAAGTWNTPNIFTITNATASTSTTTGALIVAGGAGFGGTVYATAFVGSGAGLTNLPGPSTAMVMNPVDVLKARSTNPSEGASRYTTGTEFIVATGGPLNCTGVRFVTWSTRTSRVALWDVGTGTQLATGLQAAALDFPGVATVNFDTPVTLTAFKRYRVSVCCDSSTNFYYWATANVGAFSACPWVLFTSLSWYSTSRDTYPNTASTTQQYPVEPILS